MAATMKQLDDFNRSMRIDVILTNNSYALHGIWLLKPNLSFTTAHALASPGKSPQRAQANCLSIKNQLRVGIAYSEMIAR